MKNTPFRSLNREGADCLRDAVFEVKRFQYTLFAPPADKRANRTDDANRFRYESAWHLHHGRLAVSGSG
jgi:hypothetical protein